MISHDDHTTPDQRLAQLLDDPAAFEGLQRFIEKLPELNATLELLTQFLASAPRIAENASDIVGTARHAFPDSDLSEHVQRLRDAASLGNTVVEELGPTLTQQQTLDAIKRLADQLPKLLDVISMIEQFIQGASRFADNVNGIITTARHANPNGGKDAPFITPEMTQLPAKILEIVNSAALQRLLASRVLSDGALHVMDQVAAATVDAHARTVANDLRTTRFGAFKALSNPDVQHGLALAIELARAMGQHMRDQPHDTPSHQRETTP